MTIEAMRRESAGMLRAFTIADKKSVKNVKLAIKPNTIPKGRDLPELCPAKDEDKMIGKIGNIHGDKIVTTPAIKANNTSKII